MSLPPGTEELSTTNCLKCGATSEQVLNMETQKRVGWYCLKCEYFEKAILRETFIHRFISKIGDKCDEKENDMGFGLPSNH
jgi:hypothetical protein